MKALFINMVLSLKDTTLIWQASLNPRIIQISNLQWVSASNLKLNSKIDLPFRKMRVDSLL
jgi:hypothetical protein